MPKARKTAITEHRRRMKRRGLVRLELQVRKEDAPLVRRVAKALGDPAQADSARSLLRGRFGDPEARGLKALLAAAPLEGIDLERDRSDTGRSVDL
jgi:hypothetical protein